MVGAFLVWLHHLPHFKTLPEPPGKGIEDALLRSRDALPENALRCAWVHACLYLQRLLSHH